MTNKKPLSPRVVNLPVEPPQVEMATETPAEYLHPQVITKYPKLGMQINPTMMMVLTIVSTVISLIGYQAHLMGVGETSSSKTAKYILGVDLEVDKLHHCGATCYFIGPYMVELDLNRPFTRPKRLETLPWYLELNPTSTKNVLIGTLPKKEPEVPKERPKNVLELPSNLTPDTVIAEEVDPLHGTVIFDDNRVFQAKEEKEMRHYTEGTRWVLIENPKVPGVVQKGIRVSNLELSAYEAGMEGIRFASPPLDIYRKPHEPW
jgi:hypothetical protein